MARRAWLTATCAAGLSALAAAAFLLVPDSPPPADAAPRNATAALLEEVALISEAAAFDSPSGPWTLSLPADHGGHADARAENWVVAAHLEDGTGAPVALHFALSRFGLSADDGDPEADPWALRSLYAARTVLIRDGGTGPLGEDRLSRGGGVAGDDPAAQEVWLDHWRLGHGGGPGGRGFDLAASVEGVPVRLSLTPEKPARALDPEGSAPMRGVLLSRLRVTGEIGTGAEEIPVTGLAWLGHLWGELPLPGGPLAQDRLLLQLDDGTDLSLQRSRRRDGGGGATVDGLILDAAGTPRAVSGDALEMVPTAERQAPGGGAYPVAWHVTGRDLDLRVTPLLEAAGEGTAISGRIVPVRAEGTLGNVAVAGPGTLQLDGYAE